LENERAVERVSVEVVKRALPPRGRGASARLVLAALGLAALGFGLWFRGRPEFVAWQLARDHRRGLADRPGSRVWSSEPAVVAAWLEARGTPLPPLPAHVGEAGLVGARYCALADRVAAHVLYEGDGTSVSLFVVPGPLRARSDWSVRVDGLHLRLVRSAGRTLAIVGERDEEVRAMLRVFTTTVADLDPPGLMLLP
jgi:hypothetical protein